MFIAEIDYASNKSLIESFRAQCYGSSLRQLSDVLDEVAHHFIMKDSQGSVVGMARVLRSDESSRFEVINEALLPLLPISHGEIYSECSRLCVLKSGLNRRFIQLMHFLADYHVRQSIQLSVVCLDSANARLYTSLGFQDLRLQASSQYFDEPGHIMLVDPKRLAQILSYKNPNRRPAEVC